MYMITLDQIRERMVKAIKHSGRTQTEIATAIKVSQSSIAHYIKGDIMPSVETLANLCKLLDLDANYILCQDKMDTLK